MDSLKMKLKDKDLYIQNQSKKNFRLQAAVDKSNLEISVLKRDKPVKKLIII